MTLLSVIMIEIVKLREHKELKYEAAAWFHDKWHIDTASYAQSIEECIVGNMISQWYIALHNNTIIGGAGVIANDFHNRKDLTPNLCALYLEEAYRNKGIAKKLLETAIEDMRSYKYEHLYLITDHTSFYERYGWKYLCMVQEEDGNPIRMYSFDL